jgi:hypothetical protein
MRLIRLVSLASLLVAISAGTVLAGGGNSAAAHACQQGGYLGLVGSNGETFRNTGECVSFAAHGGTFATGIVVPKGATVTFDDPVLSACNELTWGFTAAGSTAALGGKVYGCFTQPEADATVGPFATAVVLRVFLTDQTCAGTTYDSDGDHAVVTPTSGTSWSVDIADAGGFCERQNDPVAFTPPGNLSVSVVINP